MIPISNDGDGTVGVTEMMDGEDLDVFLERECDLVWGKG